MSATEAICMFGAYAFAIAMFSFFILASSQDWLWGGPCFLSAVSAVTCVYYGEREHQIGKRRG